MNRADAFCKVKAARVLAMLLSGDGGVLVSFGVKAKQHALAVAEGRAEPSHELKAPTASVMAANAQDDLAVHLVSISSHDLFVVHVLRTG